MVKRSNPYEVAFEHFLRRNELTYLAINEAKRPMAIDKNFDFLVFAKARTLAIDVKGKQLPYSTGFKWETWIHAKDVTGLAQWERMLIPKFKCQFVSLIVYSYHINGGDMLKEYLTKFHSTENYNGAIYGFPAITITKFIENKHHRSGFPGTEDEVWDLPRMKVKDLLTDVSEFLF